MGIFTTIKRNYRNAGATVWLFLYVVDNYEDRECWRESLFNWNCTGLELHNHAISVKKALLKILNEDAETYRKSIHLPDDYWRLAVRVIVNNLNAHRDDPPQEIFDLNRDALCLVAEAATREFRNGDSINIVITKSGDTWVEVLSKSPFELKRTRLGDTSK